MNKTWSIWGNSIKNNAREIGLCFDENPVVLCIGTNKLLDDCLGPMVGSLLKKMGYKGFVYGTLDAPISSLNLSEALAFLKATHKGKKLLIVDASTTSHLERIGKIVLAKNYQPFNKILWNLNVEADYFLFGVCSLHKKNFKTICCAKMGIIHKLCKTICAGLMFQKNSQIHLNKTALKLTTQQF